MKPDNSIDGITAKSDNQMGQSNDDVNKVTTDESAPAETPESTETTETTEAVQPETPPTSTPPAKEKKSGKGFWIILAILALIIGGGVGYVLGTNSATTKSQQELEQQVESLEKDLEQAKNSVSDDVSDGQDAIEEGQATLESLQAENATLQATVDEQTQKIADLEQQLEDATASDTTPQN